MKVEVRYRVSLPGMSGLVSLWVAFNHARDFMLNPAQADGPLNYFMYPYAERDGKRVEIKTGKPGYTIASRLLEHE